jgi:hypothetical protein
LIGLKNTSRFCRPDTPRPGCKKQRGFGGLMCGARRCDSRILSQFLPQTLAVPDVWRSRPMGSSPANVNRHKE